MGTDDVDRPLATASPTLADELVRPDPPSRHSTARQRMIAVVDVIEAALPGLGWTIAAIVAALFVLVAIRIASHDVSSLQDTIAQGELLLGAMSFGASLVLLRVTSRYVALTHDLVVEAQESRRQLQETRQRDEAERRRRQAQLVSCWLDDVTAPAGPPDRHGNAVSTGAWIAYRNASAEPVYGVSFWMGGLADPNGLTRGVHHKDVLRPAEEGKEWVMIEAGNPFELFVEMYFVDANGAEWMRRGDGVLQEVDASERGPSSW